MIDGDQLQSLGVQGLSVTLMASVGLELDPAGLRRSLRRVGLLSLLVLVNFGLIPVLAWAGTWLGGPPNAVALGILLSAFAPGGGTGTLLTRIAHGDLELSVVMLGLFTLLAVAITPALTFAFTSGIELGELSMGSMLETLVLFQLLPLLAGLGLRRASERWAGRADALLRPSSNLLFGGLVIGLLITRGHLLGEIGWSGGVITVVLVLATLIVPYALPGDARERAAMSLTTGVRNLAMALLLSTTFFGDLTTIAILGYGLASYLLGIPWALVVRRRLAKANA